MNLEEFLFWVFSLVTCVAAVMVVATQNVVRMAFWLVISLCSVSALFFLLQADFLGAAQLLIYVGGTVVVLVFGVMLTASGPYLKIETSPGELFLGAGVGALLFALLLYSVCATDWGALTLPIASTPAQKDSDLELRNPAYGETLQAGKSGRPLGLGFLGLRTEKLQDTSSARTPGYLLPFEIVSIHLLVVLIGAAYLARTKRRSEATEGT